MYECYTQESWAGEVAQQLRTCIVLVEDPAPISNRSQLPIVQLQRT